MAELTINTGDITAALQKNLAGYSPSLEATQVGRVLDALQKECGVADLKMSEFGIRPEEFPTLAKNAKATMGKLFLCDRIFLSEGDCMAIYQAAYK